MEIAIGSNSISGSLVVTKLDLTKVTLRFAKDELLSSLSIPLSPMWELGPMSEAIGVAVVAVMMEVLVVEGVAEDLKKSDLGCLPAAKGIEKEQELLVSTGNGK